MAKSSKTTRRTINRFSKWGSAFLSVLIASLRPSFLERSLIGLRIRNNLKTLKALMNLSGII